VQETTTLLLVSLPTIHRFYFFLTDLAIAVFYYICAAYFVHIVCAPKFFSVPATVSGVPRRISDAVHPYAELGL